MDISQTNQDPRECKHYDADGNLCERRKHKADVDGTYWVDPCHLFHGYQCPDFTPKTPQLCAQYGVDGGCHEHSQKHGSTHVSIRCKAECGEPCENYKTKTDKQ
ncbi:MAG: hypothetical protein K2J12_10870 [Muribaculaceae bacterium]|nr:hypothetical protein [Muribaculaceae bacterium]